jgi:nucleoside-diphosphate-sugar epimerase
VWFAQTNLPVTQKDFIKLIEAELGRPIKTIVGGPMMMRILGLFNKAMAETVETMYEWLNPYIVDTSKATRLLGLNPTPMKQAIQETIQWRREVG